LKAGHEHEGVVVKEDGDKESGALDGGAPDAAHGPHAPLGYPWGRAGCAARRASQQALFTCRSTTHHCRSKFNYSIFERALRDALGVLTKTFSGQHLKPVAFGPVER
jgi:hypothetical protein